MSKVDAVGFLNPQYLFKLHFKCAALFKPGFSNVTESGIRHYFNDLLVLRDTFWSNLNKFFEITQGLFLLNVL